MATEEKPEREDLKRYRENYLAEQEGIALYGVLAAAEKEPSRAGIFQKLQKAEERHADRWAALLKAAGEPLPDYSVSARVRLLGWIARIFGTQRVLPVVSSLEARDQTGYLGQPEAAGLPAEERSHSRTLRAMGSGATGREAIVRRERWHRGGRGGSLRAAVFGVNDGLVSNLSLVMGVAGAEAKPEFILLAGIAGLLAGAFSMGAGEYVSMKAQRELFEQQIAMEKQELEMSPKEEEEELALIYQAKGVPEEEASTLAHRIVQNPATAIDTLVREELGLDPSELGSPWGAAISSFLAFVTGAAVPVIPYMLSSGPATLIVSAVLSCVALFAVGALLSVFTARGPLISGFRMLGIGLMASAITFAVGWFFGVSGGG
ncbi:MAG: VIT1/CCC1 transporter family protein [Deltaproteobacteria bacterium]|nr:VIT1/CCC1 transporter family protein [Deltaproteobacteria bacterium]